MAYDLQTQIALLLGDVRGLFWSLGQIERTRQRLQSLRAQQSLSIQKRGLLTLSAGNHVVALPPDHVQTFALLRGVFSVAARLVDQVGGVWWLSVSEAGVLQLSGTAPFGATLLTSSLISWLRFSSPDATLWYVFPSETGEVIISTTQPSGSGQINTLELRDTMARAWYLSVSNAGELIVSTSGSATIVAAALEITPLQRQESEARRRNNAALSITGPPVSFTVEGKFVNIDPTPDTSYEVEHLYYTTDTSLASQPWETVSVLETVAQLLTHTQGLAAERQLQGLADEEIAMLQAIYLPGDRDARASIAGAVR